MELYVQELGSSFVLASFDAATLERVQAAASAPPALYAQAMTWLKARVPPESWPFLLHWIGGVAVPRSLELRGGLGRPAVCRRRSPPRKRLDYAETYPAWNCRLR